MRNLMVAVSLLVTAFGMNMPEVEAAGESSNAPQASSGPSQSFVTVPPLSIPIIQRSNVYGFLQIEIVLKIDDPEMQRRVRGLFPRLKDAYLRNMNAYAANHVQPGMKPDVENIGRTLQSITDHTLATNKAQVLFSQIMLQRAY